MMINRRGVRDSAPPHHQSLSRAQFQSAVQSYHQSPRIPANRLVKPSMSWDSAYSRYENTSPRKIRHSHDVMFPPVHKNASVRPLSSTRRSAKRGARRLPNVNSGNARKMAWYHEDGTVNLQALADLANKQSFPRTQSYYDRLERIRNGTWNSSATSGQSSRHDDWKLIPLRFVDDDELTPRKRAERDSLLHLLLNADDLTEEELEQIAMYVVPDQPDVELTPRSCLKKKSPRPRSSTNKKKKTKHQSSSQESPRSKSVSFSCASLEQAAEVSGSTRSQCSPRSLSSPRPQSCPNPITQSPPSPRPRRHSDPFHVASPLISPRGLGSPDEVAYFDDLEPPPDIPASPENIPEPKITYYDESGEEIEEDIQTKDQAVGEDKVEDEASPRENPTPCPDESPPSESASRPVSSLSDAEPPEHLPELDTPRVNRDTVDANTSPHSEQNSIASSTSPRPIGHGLSDSSDSPRRPPSSRSNSPSERDPAGRQRVETPVKDEDTKYSPPSEEAHDAPGKEVSSQLSAPPRPDSAPAKQSQEQPTSSRQSRLKSTQGKSSRPEPTPVKQQPPESTPTKKSGSQPTMAKESRSESTPPKQSRPESAPATETSHTNRKSRPKSSKHHRSSRSDSRSTIPAQQSAGEKHPGKENLLEQRQPQHRKKEAGKENLPGQRQHHDRKSEAPTTRDPPKRSEPAREEPQPIPVISLTWGQLGSIPPYSPRIQSPADVPVIRLKPKEVADSLHAQHSPRSSTLQGAESWSDSHGAGSGGRRRDDRMKIWLTRTAWDRHVECLD